LGVRQAVFGKGPSFQAFVPGGTRIKGGGKMTNLKGRVLVAFVLVVFTLAVSGCGTILYPERKTAALSNELDTGVVIMDCLWLLAGIIPGVIAILVDHSTGAWYLPESEVGLSPGDTVLVNIQGPAPADCQVTLGLLSASGEELTPKASARATKGKELDGPLSLTIPSGMETGGARLVLTVDGREQAYWTVCQE